ncbi:AAA family ATPase [Azohydromonas caseinilytica]|uniref:AAA family ATPase n=1 Tax=Azohydromonas caseinilytica TaxID=2728836 RepID=A0A848FIN0_9BURK|nr:AAA family ATPase [Azohydromonas caseinilytica]
MRVRDGIPLAGLIDQAGRVAAVVSKVRGAMLAPESRKTAPTFTTGQVMALTGLEKGALEYRIRRGEIPAGTVTPTGARRLFTLAEMRQCARWARGARLRPAGAQALSIAVANFKGGVAKTTTALTLAQGLSLRGHRVLVVDCDPQGSLTTLFGILPDTEVQEDDTILPLATGAQSSIRYAIRPTYWDGIDLVAAAPSLFGAEFALASRQGRRGGPEFWRVLDAGLDEVRAEYDVILIDTPPALGYVTINALMAADGLLMPLPPNQLDFASSAQFWRLFADLAHQVTGAAGQKQFAFIDVLASRVDGNDASAAVVREWMGAAYGERLLQVEIPKSAAAAATAVEFGTVYDGGGGSGRATLKRALDAFERLADVIEDQAGAYWRKQQQGGAQ